MYVCNIPNCAAALVSLPDPPSGGWGEREKEGLGNNAGSISHSSLSNGTALSTPNISSKLLKRACEVMVLGLF